MLPDFPDFKREILRRLQARIRAGAMADPLLALMPAFVIHEGHLSRISREDGSTQDMGFDLPLSASTEISVDDMATSGPKASLDAVDKMAETLQEQMAKRAIKSIEEAAESVGNSISAGGKPFSPDLYFQMLETMELSFSSDGTWEPPKLLANPETAAKGERVLELIASDPDLRAQRDRIIEKQRGAWRVREARRKLVD